jgi:hypothetical protein
LSRTVFLDLILIHPVYIHNIPAKDFSISYFFPETPHKFVRKFPHPDVGRIITATPAEQQSDYRQTANYSAAHLAMSRQPAAENVHDLQQIIIARFAKPFLPDRKNCLASMIVSTKQRCCFFFHLLWIHATPRK